MAIIFLKVHHPHYGTIQHPTIFSHMMAGHLSRCNQMPASQINDLLQILAATQHPDEELPFVNKQHIYDTINATILGDVPWQSFSVEFNGDVSKLDHEGTPWKLKSYDVWFCNPHLILHNQLGNWDFAGEIDLCAKRVYDDKNKHWYQNFMSGNWPWRQSVCTCSFWDQKYILINSIFGRTLLLKTNQIMVLHSAPSFSEVTRPLFLLPPVKMNIILSTFRMVIFTTMSDVPTEMVSPSLAFLWFLKVIFYLVTLSSISNNLL